MQVNRQDGKIRIVAERYTVTTAADRPFVYLDNAAGERLADLFVPASIHPLEGRDDTLRLGAWKVGEAAGEAELTIRAESSAWTGKTYRFRCLPRRLEFEVEVQGNGRLAEAHYFGGYYSGHLRWGSGFFGSGQRFRQGFNPEPSTDELVHFGPGEGAAIDLMGVPLPGRADWFFTPPPFCFAFEGPSEWLGLGVQARPGENHFTEYRYHGRRGSFYLSLAFEGQTAVDGSYRLPSIGFDFAADPYEALAAHVAALRAGGAVPGPTGRPHPDWWHEPIVCGWGAQCYIAAVERGRAPDYARQALYEQFMQTLEAAGVAPGTVVLDDKWQATYGDNEADSAKWPDLPGFVARQHAAGRKVLLWLKAWDPEGLPASECVTNAAGQPVAVDPTNPAYEQRLRAAVRRMLSAEGYDADGFKLDFTARTPSGPGLRRAGQAWGLELMRAYLAILHDEAKWAKPDALLMTHTPHPYLADVLDMVRLNDINTGKNITQAMRHRARVAGIACPEAAIDTDNWPITNKAVWREYMAAQPELGVPSLYYVSHIDTTQEPLDAADYALIRESWARYRARRQPA